MRNVAAACECARKTRDGGKEKKEQEKKKRRNKPRLKCVSSARGEERRTNRGRNYSERERLNCEIVLKVGKSREGRKVEGARKRETGEGREN